ncbi:MAG: hypothetical protein COA49_01075 [Bacteroidetes bacterium]|nr:MAG: hypothetical protein COA49_01075 [Bacteroidota bacterium]
MKNILITRFAIELDSDSRFFETQEGLEWFSRRIVLFDKTCLPSILSQEVRPDIWFIFISNNEYLNNELVNLVCNHSFIRVVALGKFEPFKISVSKLLLRENLTKSSTTRLDCDDALHPLYFKSLQHIQSSNTEDFLFEPIDGISVLLKNNIISRCARIRKQLAPFLSYVNRSGSDIHAFTFEHDKWPHETNKISFKSFPLWFQIAHDGNISNAFGWGWMVTRVTEFRPKSIQIFLPSLEIEHRNKIELFFSNVVNFIKRFKVK